MRQDADLLGAREAAFPTPARPWVESLASDSLYLLSKVGNRATKLLADGLAPLAMRPRGFAALQYLARHDGASQQDLVTALWSDSSSVVAIVDEFERLGVAERRRSPSDRRSYGVWLTDEGRRVLEQASSISRQVEDRILERLSPEERLQLLDTLRVIVGVGRPQD